VTSVTSSSALSGNISVDDLRPSSVAETVRCLFKHGSQRLAGWRGQPIADPEPFSTVFHQSCAFQVAEMTRDRGLRKVQTSPAASRPRILSRV